MVRVRLDRCVANSAWLSLFLGAQVHHVVVASSNHMGLLAFLNLPQTPNTRGRKKLFRFEHMWVKEPGCEEAIQKEWSFQVTGTPMFIVAQKIKQFRVQLLHWCQSQLWVTSWLIESKKAQLVMLENSSMDEYSSSEVNMLRREVNVLVEKEEIFWRQQSHVAWLKEGDRNTQFYHACASHRKKANRIRGLRDDQDVWQTDSLAINNIAVDYFHRLFDSSRPDCKTEVVD